MGECRRCQLRTSFFVIALTLLLRSAGARLERSHRRPGRPRFVYATFTHEANYPVIAAGLETWRRGVPGVIVVNSTRAHACTGAEDTTCALEARVAAPAAAVAASPLAHAGGQDDAWFAYPDSPPVSRRQPFLQRGVATVRLANQTHAGQYDWILYGDDEAVFLLDRVEQLVAGLDPSIPYYISDSYMDSCAIYARTSHPPGDEFAYCVLPQPPAAASDSAAGGGSASGQRCPGRHAAVAAPCTPSAVLSHSSECGKASRTVIREDEKRCSAVRLDEQFTASTAEPEAWCLNSTHVALTNPGLWHFASGNPGMLLSRGLLDAVSPERFRRCERRSGGFGDVALGDCLFSFGFAPTNPTDVPSEPPFHRCAFGRFDAREMTVVMRALMGQRSCGSAAVPELAPRFGACRLATFPDVEAVLNSATTWLAKAAAEGRPVGGAAAGETPRESGERRRRELEDFWRLRGEFLEFAGSACNRTVALAASGAPLPPQPPPPPPAVHVRGAGAVIGIGPRRRGQLPGRWRPGEGHY